MTFYAYIWHGVVHPEPIDVARIYLRQLRFINSPTDICSVFMYEWALELLLYCTVLYTVWPHMAREFS